MDSIKQQELKSILHYDPVSGLFTWIGSRSRKGKVAGNLRKDGHRIININGRYYLSHRLAWFYVHGVWPDDLMDHKNLNKSDNNIKNLREATKAQNNINRTRQSNNTSGYKGVYFHKRCGLYASIIGFEGKKVNLGYFKEPELAFLIRQAAEIELYGEYACLDYQ